jgi:hypothetical protein
VQYLLHERKRTVTAAILFAFYVALLLLVAISYLRTVLTLSLNPGYVPRGRKAGERDEKPRVDGAEDEDLESGLGSAHATETTPTEGSTEGLARVTTDTSLETALRNGPPQPTPDAQTSTGLGMPYAAHQPQPYWAQPEAQSFPSMKEFLDKEVFVCESDGIPRYCKYCDCWKPDRSHHCSEVGRCVYKMDHFCPWYAAQKLPGELQNAEQVMKGRRRCRRNEFPIFFPSCCFRRRLLLVRNSLNGGCHKRTKQSWLECGCEVDCDFSLVCLVRSVIPALRSLTVFIVGRVSLRFSPLP